MTPAKRVDREYRALVLLGQELRDISARVKALSRDVDAALAKVSEAVSPGQGPITAETDIVARGLVNARTANAMQNAGCRTIADVTRRDQLWWLKQPNVGRKTVDEMAAVAAQIGIKWPVMER